MSRSKLYLWGARSLVAIVLFLNLQASFLFWVFPSNYSQSFELQGIIGDTIIRALAVLFLMWNIPYIFAAAHPIRHRTSLLEAIIMQVIGVVGETAIGLQLPEQFMILRHSIQRFILFDSMGFILLMLALSLTHNCIKQSNSQFLKEN